LTQLGIVQAKQAGKILKQHGYAFDYSYTSMLKRSIWTYHTIAEELNCHWITHYKDWRLNEKHYGAL
jgi:2,3-bisphosphoglycerate-dependent phosphoglycerate mutase